MRTRTRNAAVRVGGNSAERRLVRLECSAMNRRVSSDRALTRHPIARSLALAVLGVALVGAVVMGAIVFAVLIGLFLVGYVVTLASQLFWSRAPVRVDELVARQSELIEGEYEVVDAAADGAQRRPGSSA